MGVDIIVMICLWWQMLEIGKTICIYWCLNVDRSCRWLVLVGWKITGALRLKILKPLGATIRRQSKISGEKFKNINNGKVLWLWLCDIGGYIVQFFWYTYMPLSVGRSDPYYASGCATIIWGGWSIRRLSWSLVII